MKADGNLTTALKFTKKDGVYWYDPKGTVTTITLDENCEALLYGLPVGKYHLEESKVPDGYFPIAPVACTIALENTSEAPLEVTIANAPEVKLGIDSDKYNVLIAMIMTLLLTGAAVSTTFYLRKRRREK